MSRGHHSIGEVVSLLAEEFPDLTISKLRYLENQGLVSPERTPSGYRKFQNADVAQLRWVLSLQRDHYLPHREIKRRLKELTETDDASVSSDGKNTTATRIPALFASLANREAEARGLATDVAASDVAASDLVDSGNAISKSPETEDVADSGPDDAGSNDSVGTSAGEQSNDGVAADGHTGTGSGKSAKSPKSGGTAKSADTARSAKSPKSDGSRKPSKSGGSGKSARSAKSGGTAEPDEFDESLSGMSASLIEGSVSLTTSELALAAGVDTNLVNEAMRLGLIVAVADTGHSANSSPVFDHEALLMLRAVADFADIGIPVRNLRMYKVAAEREAGIYEQVVSWRIARGDRAQITEHLNEILDLAEKMRRALLRRLMSPHLG